jgi:alpha-L-fucosidase
MNKAEMGDWYTQKLYQFKHPEYEFQCEKYGHPSRAGFKEVCNSWATDGSTLLSIAGILFLQELRE